MKALILAAGLGTRLKPITDNKPKALVEINGIPLLEHLIIKLIKFGFTSIIVNVHHYAQQVIDFIKSKESFGIDIQISDERDLLLDTGGALKKAQWFFDDDKPFLVHNVDALSNINFLEMFNHHLQQKAVATLAVQKRNSSRYFYFDDNANLCGWINEKTKEEKMVRECASRSQKFAFSGIQFVEPRIFDLLPDEDIFSLVDLYLSIASKQRIAYFDHTDSLFIDLGKKENLSEAEKILIK